MAEIKITSRLETKTVSEKFKNTYGVTLRYYFMTRNATSSWRIAELSDNKGGELVCDDSMTVSQFNKGISEQFGGRILVFDSNNQYLIDDDITFAAAKSWKPKVNKEFTITSYHPADYVIRLCKDAFNINLKIYTYEDTTYPVVSEENWLSPLASYCVNYKSIFTKDRTCASVNCSESMTIKDFEQKMKESFGILVKVANAKNQIITDKKTTLGQAANSTDVVKDSIDKTISPYWTLEMINKLSPDAKVKFKFYDNTSGRLVSVCRQTPKPEATLEYDKSMTVGELCSKFKDIFNAIVAVTDNDGNYIPYDVKLSDTPKWKYDKTKGLYIFPNMPISWLEAIFRDNLLKINNKDKNPFIYESKNTVVTCTDDMTIDEIKKVIKSKYGNDLEISSIFGNDIPTNLPLNKVCDYVKEQGFDITSYQTVGEVKANFKALYNLNIHIMRENGDDACNGWCDSYQLNSSIFGKVPSNEYLKVKGTDTIGSFVKSIKDKMGIIVCVSDNDGIAVHSGVKFNDINKLDNKNKFAVSSISAIGDIRNFFKKVLNLNIHIMRENGDDACNGWLDSYQLNSSIFGKVANDIYLDFDGSDTVAEFTKAMKDKLGIKVEIEGNQERALNINCPKETPKPQPAPEPKAEPKAEPVKEAPKAQPAPAPKAEPKAEPKKETPKPQPAPAPKAEPKAEPKKETPKVQPAPAPKAQPTQKIEITESVVNGKTAFIFNGETYTVKGKLCHAIAKYYIEQNPDITISQLRETFNIKNVNAVESVEEAIKTTDSSGTPGGSYYMKDADQIATKEGNVVVWNYWPERYYTPFMEIVEKLNFVSSGDKTVKETPKAQPAPAPKAEPKKEAPKPEVRRPSADDMNVLDRLIDAALEDFVLTDEERSVLLKKSKEIGLGEDEFKIYLNGKIQERMKDKPAEKVEEKKKGFFARLFG